jgi:transcriptional regulator with XRE-family HTH domain
VIWQPLALPCIQDGERYRKAVGTTLDEYRSPVQTTGMTEPSTLAGRVAAEVRAHLARRQFTGAGLAAALGKSEMYVSRRLRGDVPFDLIDIEQAAQYLGVAVADLLPATERAA